MSLKFIAISGTTEVTENCYVYEYGGDMVVIDCGVGFPDPEMLGIDLVIPDFTYIKQNAAKLRGIVISHGHEDHMGALPFLLKDVKAPIYSTKLVAGFIEDKFADHGMKNQKVNVFDPERDTLTLGVFKITPFRTSHSVPDSVGFAIDTPEGRLFHIPDYKFDWTPVDGRPFDIQKASMLASGGALALASDCLGSTNEGYTESEKEIEKKVEDIVAKAKKQVFFTTISSNISRMQQAINVASRLGRKVVFIGRSIDKKANIAKSLGYLHFEDRQVVSPKAVSRLADHELMYIISGSYGQPGSALYRVALGEHESLSLNREDVVIFSSDPAPPGSKTNVDFVVDKLIEAGADVHYYDLQEDLHVSGHGSIEDIKMLFALIKPKNFIPIGGTVRHMRAYGNLARDMGSKAGVFELFPGEVVEFGRAAAKKGTKVPSNRVMVDGLGIGDVGNVVLRDRQVLSRDGIAIVVAQIESATGKLIAPPEIVSRGFVFEKESTGFLGEAGKLLTKKLSSQKGGNGHRAKMVMVDFLEKFFFERTGRRPMILPVVIEI